jgi:hypothetical protein
MAKMYVKGENPLPFEKWIFRYGQPVRDDYIVAFLAVFCQQLRSVQNSTVLSTSPIKKRMF